MQIYIRPALDIGSAMCPLHHTAILDSTVGAVTTPLLCFPVTHQGKYAEADPLYLRAIEMLEKGLGPEHPNVGSALTNRAALLAAQVRAIKI